MGRLPSWHKEETRKRGTWWSDMRKTDITRTIRQTDHIQKQYQLGSTYIVVNRNSGRITLQQDTNHFHVTIHCSKVDRKTTILLRGRNEKERQMISYEKRCNKTDKIDRSYSKQYQPRSTYIVQNRNSGRITLQQDTNHFNVTSTCSPVDGKVTILWRRKDEKRERNDEKW